MIRGRTLGAGLIVGLLAPLVVAGQTADRNLEMAAQGALKTSTEVNLLSAVYVTNADISLSSGNVPDTEILEQEDPLPVTVGDSTATSTSTLTGTFTLWNASDMRQSGLKYEILILEADQEYGIGSIAPDSPRIFAALPGKEEITLEAKSTKTITIQDTIPPLPGDRYRVRLQAMTADGRQLGWQDVPLALGGATQPFVLLTPTGTAGGVFDPAEPITLTARADVPGSEGEETLTPVLKQYRHLAAATQEPPVTLAPLTLQYGSSETITLPVNAAGEAGSYRLSLELQDETGAVRSTLAEYDYIVRGETASIVRLRLGQLEAQSAQVEFAIAGAADRETDIAGIVEVEMLVDGAIVAATESSLDLPAGEVRSGNATLTFSRPVCDEPTVRLIVKNNQGEVLAERQAPGGVTADCPAGASMGTQAMLAGGAAGLLAILAVLFLWKRGRHTAAGAILLAAAGILTAQSFLPAAASGIQWQSGSGRNAVSLFVNSPQHEATAATALGIDYEARFTYSASNSLAISADMSVYILDEGGHVDNPNHRTWTRIGQKTSDSPEDYNPRTMTLAARLLLPAGYNHETTTLWTAATAGDDTAHDLTWLNLDYGPGGAPQTTDTAASNCLTPALAANKTNTCQEANIQFQLDNACQPSGEARAPLDVVLVLDRSGSMGQANKMTNAKAAAGILINQLDETQDRAAVVSYADSARIDTGLTGNLGQLRSQVNGLSPFGWTNVADGVRLGRQALQASGRAEATQLLIVLTDGIANRLLGGGACPSYVHVPTACTQSAVDEAAAAKQAGISVYTIGFDLHPSYTAPRGMLQQMASSASQFFDAPSATQLVAAFADIAQDITTQVARNVTLTYVLPAGVSFVPGSAAQVPATIQGQTMSWDFGNISVGEEPTIDFRASFAEDRPRQLVNAHPDSQIAFTDNQNQAQTLTLPATTHSPESCNPTPEPTTPSFDPGGVREVD